MRATKAVPKGSPIVTLPFTSCLSASSVENTIPPGLEAFWSATPNPTDRLAALLLQEWQLGAKSLWYNYINNLPEVGSRTVSPIHWPREMLAAFPYVSLGVEVLKQQRTWMKLHETLVRSAPAMRDVSYERFVWAMEAVASRAFQGSVDFSSPSFPLDPRVPVAVSSLALAASLVLYLQNSIPDLPMAALCTGIVLGGVFWQRTGQFRGTSCALLPVIDSANHRGTNPSCTLSLPVSAKQFVMVADKSLGVGEEITISYGNRHNDALLQYFGFVEQHNMFDRYVLVQAKDKLEAMLEDDYDKFARLQEDIVQCILNQDVEKLKAKLKKTDRIYLDLTKTAQVILEDSEVAFAQSTLCQGMSSEKKRETLLKLLRFEAVLLDKQTSRFLATHGCSFDDNNELNCWIQLFLQEKKRVLDVVCSNLRKD